MVVDLFQYSQKFSKDDEIEQTQSYKQRPALKLLSN